ncbi:MAG TPA: hypothetical protein VIG92_02980, partial [Rhodospirillales bacterium]
MPLPAPNAALRRALAVCAILAFGAAPPAHAGEPVRLRAADHGDWGRIVFDWKSPVGHSVAVHGHELTVSFDRPMEGSFEQVERRLKGYVTDARLEDGGRKAVFTLSGDFRADDFQSGNSLAIDLRRGSAQAKSGAAARNVPVRAGVHGEYSRIVFDWPGLVDYQAAEQGNALRLTFASPADVDLDAVRKDLPPFVTALEESTDGQEVAVTISAIEPAR